jgi:hypothetical protein
MSALLKHEQEQADAERHFELYVKPRLKQAREEVCDDLMRGKKVGRFTLESVLDELCQHDDYFDFLSRLAQSLIQGDHLSLHMYVEKRVGDFVDEEPDLVEDRAESLAQET